MSNAAAFSATPKSDAKPAPVKTAQDRFTFLFTTAGMVVATAYRKDPHVHQVMQPYLHALMPFLF